MNVSKEETSCPPKKKRFLYRSYASKEEFLGECKKRNYVEANSEEFYLQILIELEKTIMAESRGNNINNFKNICNLIEYTADLANQEVLTDWYDNAINPIKNTNLIILACKHNKVKILEYLFASDSTILYNLSIAIRGTNILPADEDETRHNAFYYAIRSGNIELLRVLINKWPNNYFALHTEELDEILSMAYEDLKLQSVPLSEKIEFFVENELINLRFFSNDTSGEVRPININERIDLILENITLLNSDYSDRKKIDKKFLFVAKFIAQNIHILKGQMKSTYVRLPWEEIEFCLIIFVSYRTKPHKTALFYRAILNEYKILTYLNNFAKELENEKDNIIQFANFRNLEREKVVAQIIITYPQFEDLYKVYQQIRDIYSLEKINDYLSLASSTDPKEKEGQLIITRTLQIIGEHMKCTLESPKLSNSTSQLLLPSLQEDVRNIIVNLRNSLSHASSLSNRIKIERNANANFFLQIQNDMKKIGGVIIDILRNKKIKIIRVLLEKFANGDISNEIKEIIKLLSTTEIDEIIPENFKIKEIIKLLSTTEIDEIIPENFKMIEHERLEKLITTLSDDIIDKTNYEMKLFSKINELINAGTASKTIRTDYDTGFAALKTLSISLSNDYDTDQNIICLTKRQSNRILQHIAPKIQSHGFEEIAKLAFKIFQSVRLRIQPDKFDEINRLMLEIFSITEFGTSDITWIEELREELYEKNSFISKRKQKKTDNIAEEELKNQLELKLSELKNVFSNNSLCGSFVEKLSYYKNDKKLQAVVEMLVLDILSILGNSKLENNVLFLNDNTPILTGRCLRNHLAHDNAFLDVLCSDPSVAVILNAKKFTTEDLTQNYQTIGKLISDDVFKLKRNYDRGIVAIANQEKMFAAVEEGNLDSLKDCLKQGTDINARSIDLLTTLHFAAKGPSLEVVKFILDQNVHVDVKDNNGQSPLHTAAACGRLNIVEVLIHKVGLRVNDLNNNGKTSLHVAAQNGHKKTVEVLLINKADTTIQDKRGYSPLHYAIKHNHIDIAKMLLEKDVNVDINEVSTGFTPLHVAAESGHLEMVNFLLKNKADVNAKNDNNCVPLYLAAFNGHLEVLKILIVKGADVNAGTLNGCTPLHTSVESGQKEIVDILVKYGANVNAVSKICHCTPLLFAAIFGHTNIVKTLLANKADASIPNVEGFTPLRFAVRNGHLEIVTVFLEHGVDIQARDTDNATPLHHATDCGHTKLVELFIKNKTEINAKSNGNLTPLHIAALKGHIDICDLLIKNNAAINAQDIWGNTPLHLAANSGSKKIVKLLITNKAEVNIRRNDAMTPMHTAALKGHGDIIAFLIQNKAEVDAKTDNGTTPLHLAIEIGHKDIVELLIKNKAEVNTRNPAESTPLYTAVEAGHTEIVTILTANGANVNVESNNCTPLHSAVSCNRKKIVDVLIENGANINVENNKALSLAVLAGYVDIVNLLLKNNASVNMKDTQNSTPLHMAATIGHKRIVKALIAKGAEVDAAIINNITPLCLAVEGGYEEVVEILIAYGANVNVKTNDNSTPLHIAASRGHSNVVTVLLDNKVTIDVKDIKNRTPLELAVSRGHLQVVKLLLQHKKVDMNAKGNEDRTLLHIASQGTYWNCDEGGKGSNLEMVKYLINKGCDVNARNASGSKPIHIASREGYNDTVDFFLSNGSNIDDTGAGNQTLLHYAAIKGNIETMNYLIAQGSDVNAKDANGQTPIHIAAFWGYKDFIEVLLENGAVYNVADKFNMKPLQIAKDENVINLLASTEILFRNVKRNLSLEVEKRIKAGAFVNVKNVDNTTPLHYAAWKGYDEIVHVLLQHKANSNVVGKKGWTPLHYAAKFSHLKVVKALLSNNAVYNAVSDGGKTPLDFSVDKSISGLFKLLDKSFHNIKNGNTRVVRDLYRLTDVETVKAVMSARNSENKTLVVAAMLSNFSEIQKLKQILQDGISIQIKFALTVMGKGDYQAALSIFKTAFEKRKNILGPDNPGTLDIQTYIAKVIYKLGIYEEALNIYEEILQKQQEMLGLNSKDTLSTQSAIALVLHRQEKNEEALNIFREVYQKQKELLGANHSDTLETWFHMALVLHGLGKYEEALHINKAHYEKQKTILGTNHPIALYAQNNIAMVLDSQGNHEESLKIYKEVFDKKRRVLGFEHPDTLRTLYNIAEVLFSQKQFHEALKTYQKVLNIRKTVLGPNHAETLNTQFGVANVLFEQKKFFGAFQAYRECFDQMKIVFGPNHPKVLIISIKLKLLTSVHIDSAVSEAIKHLEKGFGVH